MYSTFLCPGVLMDATEFNPGLASYPWGSRHTQIWGAAKQFKMNVDFHFDPV